MILHIIILTIVVVICNIWRYNRELRGRILLYGENLEVISPLSLREQIKEILRRQMQQYSENK